LSIEDGLGGLHYVYPYFAEASALADEAAQLGLWLLVRALPDLPADRLRLLDVFRGQAFSIAETPLHGDEEEWFHRLSAGLIQERNTLRGPPA